MKSQEHCSISSQLNGWIPAKWNPSILPHASMPFFWLLLHDETSGRLKWWTESCLDAIEGKLSHVSIWNVLRLARRWNKAPSLQVCHTVFLKLAVENYNVHLWTLRSVSSPSPSPGVVKHRWHRHKEKSETFSLWYCIQMCTVNVLSFIRLLLFLSGCRIEERFFFYQFVRLHFSHSFIWVDKLYFMLW